MSADRVAVVVIDRLDGTRITFAADGPRVVFPAGFTIAPGDVVRAGVAEVREVPASFVAASARPARTPGIVRP